MRRISNFHNSLILCALAAFFGGCGTAFFTPGKTKKARVGERTELASELDSLPEPKEQIVVAVYSFRDQTGQYKPTENGGSFSTAVTQGASNILLKSLQDSRYFIPIERENITNLLNERKIIRSTRQQYGNNEELPALLFAGVMIEGGIVSYDANIITGGAGARYFGTGASSQYRQDRVTVYLRAISVSNGKVLKTVYSSKQILSQSLEGGVFRYVRFRRILEAETGITYNEPSEMAVTEAIERAVKTLVLEGLKDGLWDCREAGARKKLLDDYEKEEKEMAAIDVFGQKTELRRRRTAFEISGAGLFYQGDYALPQARGGAEVGLRFSKKPSWGWGLAAGASELATRSGFESRTTWADFDAEYRLLPFYRFSPFWAAGAGAVFSQKSSALVLPKIHFGGGFEVFGKKSTAFFVKTDLNYVPSDQLDGIDQGRLNDFFWRGSAGLRFYFGKKIESSRPIFSSESGEKKKGPMSDF